MNELRALLVDDEQLAREELCFLLEQIGDIDVVAQASNGIEALRVIEEAKVRRLGGTKDIPIAVRVLAATNRAP